MRIAATRADTPNPARRAAYHKALCERLIEIKSRDGTAAGGASPRPLRAQENSAKMRAMEVNIPTLFLAIIATSAALAVSLGAVAYRHNRDGLFFWAVALALHAMAYALLDAHDAIGEGFSIVAGNALLAASFSMFAEALFRFQQRRAPRWLIWFPVAVVAVSFAGLIDNQPARVIAAAVNFSSQCLIVLLPLAQKRRQTPGRGQDFLAAGIALLIAILLLRALGAASGVIEIQAETESSGIQAGTYLSLLISLVLMSLGFVLMTKERADQLNYALAIQDELTGLANRRRLNEVLASEWARASRSGQPLALAMLDVDLFKKYNDRYGHQAGDECLKQVARALQAAAHRAGDLAARYGGEEFSLVLPNTDLDGARHVAEAARLTIEALALAHESSPFGKVTVSAGVAVYGNDCYKDVASLLGAADAALYVAKQEGRNRVQLAPPPAGADQPVKAPHFVHLVWHAAYASGNATIDAQHRNLFDDANQLLSAILEDAPRETVAARIDALVLDVTRHFGDEEAILAATLFPGVAQHAAIHRHLLERAGELVRHFNAGALNAGEVFQFLAHDVVARHMLGVDRKFFPYLATPR